MSHLKPFNSSADYVVTKAFIEHGHSYQIGEDYNPRFNSSKRKFRHYIARRIEVKALEVAAKVEEKIVEPEAVVVAEEAPVVKKTTRRKKAATKDSD